MVSESLEELESLLQARKEVLSQIARLQAQAGVTSAAVREAVRKYLRGLIQEEGNLVTEKVLREADRLYDVENTARIIAEALGLSVYDLRKALARQREVRCADCGEVFTVLELRRKGGYTLSSETLCRRCRRRWEEKRREEAAWASARREAEERKRLQVEEQILQEIFAAGDPTAVEEFRRRLIRYALYWAAGRPPMLTAAGEILHAGGGCMICGCRSFDLLVASPEHLSSPTDVYRTLWRMRPSNYFEDVVPLPLLDMPLLFLCRRCAEAAAETHRRIELRAVQTEREKKGRVTVEACGVRLVLRRERSRLFPWMEEETV